MHHRQGYIQQVAGEELGENTKEKGKYVVGKINRAESGSPWKTVVCC